MTTTGIDAPAPAGRRPWARLGLLAGRLAEPVDIGPLIVLRVAFGLLMSAGAVRFMARGWIQQLYVLPRFHFTYYGFDWVRPLPEAGLWAVFVLLAVLGVCIALGLAYRPAMAAFFVLFTYIELLDKTTYLNHYYFVSVLSLLLLFLPLNGRYALDNRLGLAPLRPTVPAWMVWAVRAQLVLVYFFAGLAKLNADWLLAAQPLRIWLHARTGTPLIGGLFDYAWVAYAMSWAGAAFDLTIGLWLCWRPTRLPAYLAVIVFHTLTGVLFNIGLFPWIMIGCTLVFFDWKLPKYELRDTKYELGGVADHRPPTAERRRWNFQSHTWLLRLMGRGEATGRRINGERRRGEATGRQLDGDLTKPLPVASPLRHSTTNDERRSSSSSFLPFSLSPLLPRSLSPLLPRSPAPLLVITLLTLQLLLPLRHWLYPGDVNWTEEGGRFAWRVMIVEKTGQATFTVRDKAGGGESVVFPRDYLTDLQEKQMVFQPDMIVQFARYLADQFPGDVEVRARVYVSWNGRPSRLLIDPTVDLLTVSAGPQPKPWILQPW